MPGMISRGVVHRSLSLDELLLPSIHRYFFVYSYPLNKKIFMAKSGRKKKGGGKSTSTPEPKPELDMPGFTSPPLEISAEMDAAEGLEQIVSWPLSECS